MASFFEPEPFLFDPTSSFLEDTSSSFLSFASFSDLIDSSAFDLSSWDTSTLGGSKSSPSSSSRPQTSSYSSGSDTSTPSSSDPFIVIGEAFEPATPAGEIGIFHTPSKAGPFKINKAQAGGGISMSYRSSGEWDTPVTPSLTNRSSVDAFASGSFSKSTLCTPSSAPFHWDDASTSTLGASSSYRAVPVSPSPHRTTSNPILNSRPRLPVKTVSSMPALSEEDHSTPSAWFDGTDLTCPELGSQNGSLDIKDDLLGEDFEWVFSNSNFSGLSDQVPIESTIFAAFQSHDSKSLMSQDILTDNWMSGSSSQSFDLSEFTIDPLAIMAHNVGTEDEPSRPSSAPELNGKEGSGQLLSVPMKDTMHRSVSSDSLADQRYAPAREQYSFDAHQISGDALQSMYNNAPQSYIAYPRALPLTTSQSRRSSSAAKGLSIQINPTNYSTYMQSPLPPTPQSVSFGDFSSSQSQAVSISRSGSQPIASSRSKSNGSQATSSSDSYALPAHLLRAQAIVQMQQAREEAEQADYRRQAASRRVTMAEASVMQPHSSSQGQTHSQSQHGAQNIMGWQGPSAQTASLPILTTTPLVTVHPPPANYSVNHGAPTTPHRVHPPPYPGTGRPISRLPSTPFKTRKISGSPSKRSPAKRRAVSNTGSGGGGGFSFGETLFINFTSDDAEKLLTGVAPSGSQSKRKREEDAARALDVGDATRERSKRSRSGE